MASAAAVAVARMEGSVAAYAEDSGWCAGVCGRELREEMSSKMSGLVVVKERERALGGAGVRGMDVERSRGCQYR